MTAFAQEVAQDIAAAKQHEAQEGLTFRITVTDTDKSAESISISALKEF